MLILLRIVFALGLLTSVGYALSYLFTGHYRDLIVALRVLVITIAAAIILIAGIYLERAFG